jgi:hypothetical protein
LNINGFTGWARDNAGFAERISIDVIKLPHQAGDIVKIACVGEGDLQ